MTDVVTWDRLGPADTIPETELMAEVRGSVLRLLAELPAPPGRIRVSARDVAVELEWPSASLAVPLAAAHITVAAPPADQPTTDQPSPGSHAVTAATVGTFYRMPEPGAQPFVKVGDPVQAGQQLAIVEAMKLMIPVESDVDGWVCEVLKDDGQPVEFGEPLFLIGRK